MNAKKKQTNKQTIKLIIKKDDHGWRKMTHAIENLRLRFSLCPSATVAGGGGGGQIKPPPLWSEIMITLIITKIRNYKKINGIFLYSCKPLL